MRYNFRDLYYIKIFFPSYGSVLDKDLLLTFYFLFCQNLEP